MKPTKVHLPIDTIKENIISAFETSANIILKASPGSGKTTRVPTYLLEKTSKKIYILEPRRLAAKLAALRVASELDEKIGQTAGYVFRYEKVMSADTRILFLTEGTFLKILSRNKQLDDVGLIILDEFHERHLSTDAALSFITKLQKDSRPDLKIMVMSATIETQNLEFYLSSFAKTTTIDLVAQRFELKINYLPNVTDVIQASLQRKVHAAVLEILELDAAGDILVFLPGMREIRECHASLAQLCEYNEISCHILHGDLDSAEQIKVLEPGTFRKIILSTNIAESSVTIAGVRIVIDSGLQRESSYNFFSGLPELNISKISKASAEQRAGRANREGAGLCFRLYAQLDFDQRSYLQKPDILKSDLSELYLMSLNLFNLSLDQLDWFEAPPISALKNSHELLFAINAIDQSKQITAIGKQILNYPLHPRLARILVEAEKSSSNIYHQILDFIADLLGEKQKHRFIQLLDKNIPTTNQITKSMEEILLVGYPDRVARARGEKYFDVITQNGDTIKISPQISDEFNPHHPLWIVLDLNNKGDVIKCVAIEEEWLYDLVPFPLTEEDKYFWDDRKEQVFKSERTMLGKILLSENKIESKICNQDTQKILIEKACAHIKSLSLTQEYERLLTLNKTLNNIELSLFDDSILQDFFKDKLNFGTAEKEQLAYYFFSSLKDIIDPDLVYNLEIDFPKTIQLTDKRKIPIIYDRTQDPAIESLIQDFYGLSRTPLLAKGKISLTVKLLGPHKRAIQVTQDLASFWKNTYPTMYKELSREYPRHHWPLSPESALPILLKRQLPALIFVLFFFFR
jgi:ATP-dependent helicase HrpB